MQKPYQINQKTPLVWAVSVSVTVTSSLSTDSTPSAPICARHPNHPSKSLTLDPSILDPTLCPRSRWFPSSFANHLHTLFARSGIFLSFSLLLLLIFLASPRLPSHHIPSSVSPDSYLTPTIDSCRVCDSNQLNQLDLDNVVLLAIVTYHLASQWS